MVALHEDVPGPSVLEGEACMTFARSWPVRAQRSWS